MRIAVVGGGGFRTPLLVGELARIGLAGEVVLHDVSADRLERIGAVLRGLNRDPPLPFDIGWTTDLDRAVDGAGAVLAQIRPGGAEARVIDESVALAAGVLGQETVGPGGICFALRTVPAMRSVAVTVARRAPGAWLVNLTNPAGIVTQAIRDVLGDRVVGICDSPAALCAHVARALGRPASSLAFDYAGLNHLGWLLGVRETGGEDLLPALLRDDARLGKVDEAVNLGIDRIRRLGAIPNEYLLYLERADDILRTLRERGTTRGQEIAEQQRAFFEGPVGSDDEMRATWRAVLDRRHATYMGEARPPNARPTADDAFSDDGDLGEAGYGAVVADFLLAASSTHATRLILNAANRGRLVEVGDEEIVEATCAVDANGVRAIPGAPLPPESSSLVARSKEVERLAIRAATTGSAAAAVDAIAAHPLVPSRAVAERILADSLDRQPILREVIA